MKEISLDEKKGIMLDMLSEIDLFCRENNIIYFLTGGTLLGAIRHNGYIPWDDDIDICLLRKDYDRLLAEFKSSSGNVEIRSLANTKGYIWPAAKAVDNRTVMLENGRQVKGVGVNIDIFPMDNVNGDYECVKNRVLKIKRIKDALTLKYLKLEKRRSFLKNAVIVFGRILYLVPTSWFIKKIDILSRESEGEETDYVCCFAGAWGIKEITKAEYFSSVQRHKFENGEFNVPIGFHEYLTDVYGDYMTPPPPEKQITHHASVVYWK